MFPAKGIYKLGLLVLFLSLLLVACGQAPVEGRADSAQTIIVYKLASCGCCSEWTTYLEEHDFTVTVNESVDMAAIKDQNQVPAALRSCHTALIGGYVIEGHVPVEEINRLLAEQPEDLGLAVAGMPVGSPGMEIDGVEPVPFDVIAFDAAGNTSVYASYPINQ